MSSESKLGYIGKSQDEADAEAGALFWENPSTLNNNYTLTAGTNALVVGPLTVADGVSITVPDGQRLVII